MARSALTKTRNSSDMAKLRFTQGRIHCTVRYDRGELEAGPHAVLTLSLNGDPEAEITFKQGDDSRREIMVPLALRSGNNELRLQATLHGPPASTVAELLLTDDGHEILRVQFQTDRSLETIDQSWSLNAP